MSIYGGPDIVTDGLVFCIDIAITRVYNKELSNEILYNYNATKGRFGL